MAQGETSPQALAELGDKHLKCGLPALADALTGSMGDIHCQLLTQHLDRIELIDRHIEELNKLAAAQMQRYQDAVTRLIEIPGIGAEAAQEILAEIGPQAAAFPSAQQLASWIGVCPGSNESAGENHSGRSPKGNRFLRRLLCQAAQAAARTNGSHLQSVFKRLVVRLGYVKAIWALAHRICKIVWNILRKGTIHRVQRSSKSQSHTTGDQPSSQGSSQTRLLSITFDGANADVARMLPMAPSKFAMNASVHGMHSRMPVRPAASAHQRPMVGNIGDML